jgi:hypothetical protein
VAADANRFGPAGHLHFRAALAAEFLVAALDARLLAPAPLVLAFHGNLLDARMGSNKGATDGWIRDRFPERLLQVLMLPLQKPWFERGNA